MRDVEKLIANQGSKTVRDIYETIQHWSWHDLSILHWALDIRCEIAA